VFVSFPRFCLFIFLAVGPHHHHQNMVNRFVDSISRTLTAAVSSSIVSAAFYFWLAPLLAPALSPISRPADSFPWWAPATVKLFESILLSTTTLANRTSLSLDLVTCSLGCGAHWDYRTNTVLATVVLVLLYSYSNDSEPSCC
jgi:hypothetical protein